MQFLLIGLFNSVYLYRVGTKIIFQLNSVLATLNRYDNPPRFRGNSEKLVSF